MMMPYICTKFQENLLDRIKFIQDIFFIRKKKKKKTERGIIPQKITGGVSSFFCTLSDGDFY